jgi:hypothetical protein
MIASNGIIVTLGVAQGRGYVETTKGTMDVEE